MRRGVSSKVGHRWRRPSYATWLEYCQRCGLVALKNEATYRAIKAGCFLEDEVVMDLTGPDGGPAR